MADDAALDAAGRLHDAAREDADVTP